MAEKSRRAQRRRVDRVGQEPAVVSARSAAATEALPNAAEGVGRIPATVDELTVSTGNAFQMVDGLLGGEVPNIGFDASDKLGQWTQARLRLARERGDEDVASLGRAFDVWVQLQDALRGTFFEREEGVGAKQLLSLLSLSNDELSEPRHRKAALDLLRDSAPLADAIQPLIDRAAKELPNGDRATLMDSLSSVQSRTSQGDSTMTLIGGLRQLADRMDTLDVIGDEGRALTHAWHLENEPVLLRHLSLVDPFAGTIENFQYWGDRKAVAHERDRFGDHSILELSRDRTSELSVDLIMRADRLGDSTSDGDRALARSCAVVAEWLNGKQAFYAEADAYDMEQQHLVGERAEELVGLLEALDVIKDADPRLFVMILGQNPGHGDSRSIYYGNYLHKSLYNTREMIEGMRARTAERAAKGHAGDIDVGMQEARLMKMMDQILEMDQSIDVFSNALSQQSQQAIMQRAGEYLTSLPEKDRAAVGGIGAIMSLLPMTMAAMAQRELEQFREASLERPEERLRVLMDDPEKPLMLLDYISSLSDSQLRNLGVRQELLRVFPRELIDDPMRFRVVCHHCDAEVIEPLFNRLSMVEENADGQMSLGPYFRVLTRAADARAPRRYLPTAGEDMRQIESLVEGATRHRLFGVDVRTVLKDLKRDDWSGRGTKLLNQFAQEHSGEGDRFFPENGGVQIRTGHVASYLELFQKNAVHAMDLPFMLAQHLNTTDWLQHSKGEYEPAHLGEILPDIMRVAAALPGTQGWRPFGRLMEHAPVEQMTVEDLQQVMTVIQENAIHMVGGAKKRDAFPYVGMLKFCARAIKRLQRDGESSTDPSDILDLVHFISPSKEGDEAYGGYITDALHSEVPEEDREHFIQVYGLELLHLPEAEAGISGRTRDQKLEHFHKTLPAFLSHRTGWRLMLDNLDWLNEQFGEAEVNSTVAQVIGDATDSNQELLWSARYNSTDTDWYRFGSGKRFSAQAYLDLYHSAPETAAKEAAELLVYGWGLQMQHLQHSTLPVEPRDITGFGYFTPVGAPSDEPDARIYKVGDIGREVLGEVEHTIGVDTLMKEGMRLPGVDAVEMDVLWVELFSRVDPMKRFELLVELGVLGETRPAIRPGEDPIPIYPLLHNSALHATLLGMVPVGDLKQRHTYVEMTIPRILVTPLDADAGRMDQVINTRDLAQAIRLDKQSVATLLRNGFLDGAAFVEYESPDTTQRERDRRLVEWFLESEKSTKSVLAYNMATGALV